MLLYRTLIIDRDVYGSHGIPVLFWKSTTSVVLVPLISYLRIDISRSYQFPVESTSISYICNAISGSENKTRRIVLDQTTRFTRNFCDKSTTEMRKQFLSFIHVERSIIERWRHDLII